MPKGSKSFGRSATSASGRALCRWYYTLGPQKNEEIFKNLKVEPVSKFIQNYRANCKEHVERMDSSRIPNNLLNYRPHGKRSLGRSLKRWSETVTGHLA
jgi:hypothetical protein